MSKGRKTESRRSLCLALALLLAGPARAAPESAEVQYNQGNAQYRAGLFADAAGSYEIAAAWAKTDSMRARCWYNLGNCMVRMAEGLRETDPHAAVSYCFQAEGFYRLALGCDDQLSDAAYNLEITMRLSAEIKEQIRERQKKKDEAEEPPGDLGEDSESEDNSDMDYEESGEDSAMYEEADPFGDFSEYEEIRGLPPPNKTETDILAEEIRNQERRRKKKAGEYKPVEKDW